jgi:hemerythrin
MLLMWTDNLSVGIKRFDDDHKRLLSILHELDSAARAADGSGKIEKEEIEIALHRLENYVRYHCDREEQVMAQTHYTGLKAHQVEHAKLAAMIAEMQARFKESTSVKDAAEVMQLIFDWLIDHIHVTDKQYSYHLHSHQVY